jgi:glucose-6-phosphate isomerase
MITLPDGRILRHFVVVCAIARDQNGVFVFDQRTIDLYAETAEDVLPKFARLYPDFTYLYHDEMEN